MKHYFICWLLLIACSACQSKVFQLTGQFKSPVRSNDIEAYLPGNHRDSLVAKGLLDADGNFTLPLAIKPGTLIEIRANGDRIRIPVVTGNGKYQLSEDHQDYYFNSEGPSLQNQLTDYLKKEKELTDEYSLLCMGYDTIRNIHQKSERSRILSEKFQQNEKFRIAGIQKFAGTEIAQYILYKTLYYYGQDYQAFTKAMEALGDSIPDTQMKSSILSAYKKLKSAQLTGKAPDFTLTDKNGKQVSLSDFRTKYILLDFWASWCAPCREKNRELNKHYPQLQKQGIEVISVSLDDNKALWLKAVKEDGVAWTQLADLEGFKRSKVRQDYKVEQVPTVYLIDPAGNIVCKGPTMEELMKL